MLILNYNPKKSDVLLEDGNIETYLLSSIKLPITIIISQVSIIYVLRKLIAQNKIKHSDVVIQINNTTYTINKTGRFDSYPDENDLFDDCLNAILNSASSSAG